MMRSKDAEFYVCCFLIVVAGLLGNLIPVYKDEFTSFVIGVAVFYVVDTLLRE